jgi:hypothetical protein
MNTRLAAAAGFLVLRRAVRRRRARFITLYMQQQRQRRLTQIEFRRGQLRLARMQLLYDLIFVHVGSGYMAMGEVPRAPCLLPVQHSMMVMWNELINPSKLLHSIGVTSKEFWYLAHFYDQYRRQMGSLTDTAASFRLTSFGFTWPELYVAFDFLKNYHTLREMERFYQLSKSSLELLIPKAVQVYCTMLSAMLMHTWPTLQEQTNMISKLDPLLAVHNCFFLVDTAKHGNVDSLDIPTAHTHYSVHKGFGLVLIIFTDILGRLIWIEVSFDGNSADVPLYRISSPYRQADGCTFAIDKTGLGDQSFVGPSSCLPGASQLLNTGNQGVMPQALVLFAAMHRRAMRRLRQPVECGIRLGKKGIGSNVEKLRFSLVTQDGRDRAKVMIKAAFLHQHAIQRMRGQVCMSNPEVLNPTSPLGRVDIAQKIINVGAEMLETAPGRSQQFHGCLSNGASQVFPDPIRFPGFP